MMRRELGWIACIALCAGLLGSGTEMALAGEVQYNGIVLPEVWPPKVDAEDIKMRRPIAEPPYLQHPPAVIPIDVGRQLFVDDFLIEQTTLHRTFHLARYYPDNPVLKPDKPWEQEGGPTAMPFSDGVWYDPADRLFKMWYMAGYVRGTAYATSEDGIRWDKPLLDVQPGTNLVHTVSRDSGTVWMDLDEKDPQRRYKLFIFPMSRDTDSLSIYFSPDGIHWGDRVARSGPCGDRTTVFYNPFRRVWIYGVRAGLDDVARIRRYWEHPDAAAGAKWEAGRPALWVGTDRLDPPRADLKTPCELYNLDAVAYESLLLGLFSIWRGQPGDRPKPNEVCLGFSRDGFHWYRPDRRAFLPVSEHQGDWNWGNVQSAGGGCLIAGDQLYFYVSGRAGVPGSSSSGVCSTGLATLRRDGFASMDADATGGTLTTRLVTFKGKYPFVNLDALQGELRLEILDENGDSIPPFTRDNCTPLHGDHTRAPVHWSGTEDVSTIAGKKVRLRFHLTNGRLYAFWISPEASGASHGYVAAGGPGFTGNTDTIGTPGAYRLSSGKPPRATSGSD